MRQQIKKWYEQKVKIDVIGNTFSTSHATLLSFDEMGIVIAENDGLIAAIPWGNIFYIQPSSEEFLPDEKIRASSTFDKTSEITNNDFSNFGKSEESVDLAHFLSDEDSSESDDYNDCRKKSTLSKDLASFLTVDSSSESDDYNDCRITSHEPDEYHAEYDTRSNSSGIDLF